MHAADAHPAGRHALRHTLRGALPKTSMLSELPNAGAQVADRSCFQTSFANHPSTDLSSEEADSHMHGMREPLLCARRAF